MATMRSSTSSGARQERSRISTTTAAYDYRQWTPWEKVDLDIQGDYLIPAVVNRAVSILAGVYRGR